MTQTIKVLTNKKNPNTKIKVDDIKDIFIKDVKTKPISYFPTANPPLELQILIDKFEYFIFFKHSYLNCWSFETSQERDRIYEKIKPYFEFKEVEEIEID